MIFSTMAMLLLLCLFLYALVGFESASVGIFNGTDADIADYPWMVSIYLESIGFKCGGSLISPNWVLTSARCGEAQLVIQAGSNKRDGVSGMSTEVDEFFEHPNFTYKDDNTPLNDLTLLRLSSPLNGTNIAPIKLPEADATLPEGSSLTIAGWGEKTNNNKYSDDLQVTTIEVLAKESCIRGYKDHDLIVDSDAEFCAGDFDIAHGICVGDTGGAAEINGTIYGIVSWGVDSCSKLRPVPVVLVNLPIYRDWIRSVTEL